MLLYVQLRLFFTDTTVQINEIKRRKMKKLLYLLLYQKYIYKLIRITVASIRVILKTEKKNKNDESPLYLRLIKDRKTKFISLGCYIKEEHWDKEKSLVKRKHPNSQRLNNLIAQKIAEASDVTLELETKSKNVTSRQIKNKITGTGIKSFTDFAAEYIIQLEKSKVVGTYRRVKSVLDKFSLYTKGANMAFADIDYQFLKKYENYLTYELGNKINTVHSNLKVFRKLFNDAVREDLIEPNLNPFIKFKLKLEKTSRDYLDEEELKRMEDLDLDPASQIYHHRNMYVFAAYAGGIRVSDLLVLRWSNINSTHVTLTTQKTKEVVSIKLPNKAQEILDVYRIISGSKPSNFVFPFLDSDIEYNELTLFKAISSRTAYANKDLKVIAKRANIEKRISNHTSRSTWATRALRKGMRIEYVSKLMAHNSIKTTQIYSKIVNSELDKAMDVFD
jgi:integrase/recombinase XerD